MTRWRPIGVIALLWCVASPLVHGRAGKSTTTLSDTSMEAEENHTMREYFMPDNVRMRQIFERSRKCSSMIEYNYVCNRECHLSTFPSASNPACVYMRADENTTLPRCFDLPIAYNYTIDRTAMARLDEFRVLQQFPRCWSKIAPLLCAVVYRPCQGVRTTRPSRYESRSLGRNLTKLEINETRVLYEIFTPTFCTDAMRECAFAIDLGLWPNFIDCKSRVDSKYIARDIPLNETRTAFSSHFYDKCKTRYIGAQAPPRSVCVWPLVEIGNGVELGMHPVIDNCYLPCKSQLFESEGVYIMSRWMNSVVTLLLMTVFAFIGLYLWLFSQAYLERYEVFLLTQAFLCIIVYYLAWAVLSVDRVADAGICTANGTARLELERIRVNHFQSLESLLSPCVVEAAVFLCAPLSAFAWLNIFLAHRFWATDFGCADFGLWRFESRPATAAAASERSHVSVSARRALMLVIYSFGTALALFAVMAFEIPVDGVMRVCHFAALSSDSPNRIYLVYAPILLMNLSFTTAIIARYFPRRCGPKAEKHRRSLETTNSSAAITSGGTSEQSSNSENPLLPRAMQPSMRNFDSERRRHVFSLLHYSHIYFNDGRKSTLVGENDEAKINALEKGSVLTDRSVFLIFLSNLIFCCIGVYTLINTSNSTAYSERNIILDNISCSLRSPNFPAIKFNSTISDCSMHRFGIVDAFQFGALALVVPALPFFVAFCCVICALLCGEQRNARVLRMIRSNFFSCPSSFDDTASMLSIASSAKISLKGVNCPETGLLSKKSAESSCKAYNEFAESGHNAEASLTGSQLHSPLPQSMDGSDFSTKSRRLLEQQLILQQQLLELQRQQQQHQQQQNFQPPLSPSIYQLPGTPIPQQTLQNVWANGSVTGISTGFPFLQPSPATPLSGSVSPIPLPYYTQYVEGGILPQGMAPPMYNLPQPTYYMPPTVLQQPSPSISPLYSMWNPYGGYLSASAGDVGSLVDGYSTPIRDAYDSTPHPVASSTANSDPIHKSGERKIDLNRNYRTHVITKLLHEKYQKQSQKRQSIPHNTLANFLEEAASIRSGNSSATLNMTSVSQQPTVAPAIHPVVVNALYECYKQGVEHGEQQMKNRVEEMTTLYQHYSEQLKQLFGDKYQSVLHHLMGNPTEMESSTKSSEIQSSHNADDLNTAAATAKKSSPLPRIEAKIPMVFGADGQRIMREYHARHKGHIASVSCPNYFSNERITCKRHAQTMDDHFLTDDVASASDAERQTFTSAESSTRMCATNFDDEGAISEDEDTCDESGDSRGSDFFESDEVIEDEEGDETECDEKSLATRSGLSDDFNSDASDPEEEKLYNLQIERLKKQKLENSSLQCAVADSEMFNMPIKDV